MENLVDAERLLSAVFGDNKKSRPSLRWLQYQTKRRTIPFFRMPRVIIHPVPETAPKDFYTREEVIRLLNISERQLKAWERYDLIRPSEQFAFSDLIALRTLMKLRENRVQLARIRVAMMRESGFAFRISQGHSFSPKGAGTCGIGRAE